MQTAQYLNPASTLYKDSTTRSGKWTDRSDISSSVQPEGLLMLAWTRESRCFCMASLYVVSTLFSRSILLLGFVNRRKFWSFFRIEVVGLNGGERIIGDLGYLLRAIGLLCGLLEIDGEADN